MTVVYPHMTVIKAEIGASSDWDVEELQLLPVNDGDKRLLLLPKQAWRS